MNSGTRVMPRAGKAASSSAERNRERELVSSRGTGVSRKPGPRRAVSGLAAEKKEDCWQFAKQEEMVTQALQCEGKKGLLSHMAGTAWQPISLA